mmetsp:Transcript_11020/g.23628  ORF Transcript_11020/g.23628 Transcript_11020/m.23628 type:complete len:205 (+) Transcript_11020:364-978(+)
MTSTCPPAARRSSGVRFPRTNLLCLALVETVPSWTRAAQSSAAISRNVRCMSLLEVNLRRTAPTCARRAAVKEERRACSRKWCASKNRARRLPRASPRRAAPKTRASRTRFAFSNPRLRPSHPLRSPYASQTRAPWSSVARSRNASCSQNPRVVILLETSLRRTAPTCARRAAVKRERRACSRKWCASKRRAHRLQRVRTSAQI